MKELELDEKQILILDNNFVIDSFGMEVLEVYFSLINHGGMDEFVPPGIAINVEKGGGVVWDYWKDKIENENDRLDTFFGSISYAYERYGFKDLYYLIDGHHKTIARALHHRALKFLEPENDKDIRILEKMDGKQELYSLNFDTGRRKGVDGVRSWVLNFEEWYINQEAGLCPLFEQLKIITGDAPYLPKYMVERYRGWADEAGEIPFKEGFILPKKGVDYALPSCDDIF